MGTFNADCDPSAKQSRGIAAWSVSVVLALTVSTAALGADTLRLAIGERGDWENAAPVLGQRAGFFKKHGLMLKLQATRGGGETLQAVIAGKADVGLGVGTAGVLGAFAIGAPVRAIANSTTGADDLFWYVPAGSTIKSIKEADGKTIAYSSKGSSTSLTVLAFNREFGIQAKPVATGGAAATFRQTMAGQIDIGWSAPPFGVAAVQQGRIRIVGRQGDLPAYRDQTIRLMIATPALLEQRRAVVDRFLQAYSETLEWMYGDPAALKAYAKWAGVSEPVAKALRDQFYPRDNLRLDRLSGLDAAMADAVSLQYLPAPLTREQQDELFRHYARGAK